MSDADVVREVLAGRYESFGTLVERHFVSVYALCLSYVKNTVEAEDVAQETFVRCYNRLDTLKNPRKFAAWLASIARNICINHIRADSRRRKLMTDYAGNGMEHVPAMDAERRELLRTVRRAVDTLPAKTREAIYLFYFEEKSLKEIGAFLGKSPNAVSGLLKYGRRKLKDTLWQEAEELIKELRPRKEAVANVCAAIPLGKAAWCLKGSATVVSTSAAAAAKLAHNVGLAVMGKKLALGLGAALLAVCLFYGLSNKLTRETADELGKATLITNGRPETLARRRIDNGILSPIAEPLVDPLPSGLNADSGSVEKIPTETNVETAIPVTVMGRITGRVYDEVSGEGVEGVTVGTEPLGEEEPGNQTPHQSTMIQDTDENGIYELLVPTPATYTISVGETDFYVGPMPGPQEIELSSGQHADGVDFAFAHGGSISGTVFDPDGRRIAGADMFLINDSKADIHFSTSREDGSYRFMGLRLGDKHIVRADCKDYGSSQSDGVRVTEDEPDVTDFDIRFGGGHTVYGRIVDTQGNGIASVQVQLKSWYGADGGVYTNLTYARAATTDDKGFFSISNVDPGSYGTSLLSDEFNHVDGGGFTMPPDADLHDLVIVVKPKGQGFIRGMVTDRNGQPVDRAGVFATDFAATIGASDLTDAMGFYSIEGLDGTGTYLVKTRARGYRTASRKEVAVNSTGVDFVVDKCGQISGRVIDAVSGAPIEEFLVRAMRPYDFEDDEVPGFRGVQKRFVSPKGIFLLDNVEPALVSVSARAEGYATASSDYVEVPAGETVDGLEFWLVPGGDGGIEGFLVDADGNPITTVQIGYSALLQDGSRLPIQPARTDEQSAFSLPHTLPEGVHPTVVLGRRTAEGTLELAVIDNVEIVADGVTDLGVVRLEPVSAEQFQAVFGTE